ncbi:unnamed protein product [Camellia sinensis]
MTISVNPRLTPFSSLPIRLFYILEVGKTTLKKGAWSREEDQKLINYINRYRIWIWSEMPKAAGLLRSGKSCRLQ